MYTHETDLIQLLSPTTCRKHPEGDHGGEVEGGNASAHAQGNSVAGQVHVLRDARQMLAKQEVEIAAQVLDNLNTVGVEEEVFS